MENVDLIQAAVIIAAFCLQLLAEAFCFSVCGVCSRSTQAVPWKEKQTNGYGYGMDYSKYFCSLATFSILFFLLYIEEFKKGIYFCLSASVSLRFRGKQNKKKPNQNMKIQMSQFIQSMMCWLDRVLVFGYVVHISRSSLL